MPNILYAKIGPIHHGIIHRFPEDKGGTKESFPYLANNHVHMLEFNFWIEQHHNERDIEYLEADRIIRKDIVFLFGGADYYNQENTRTWSCETIATNLYKKLIQNEVFKGRSIRISVLEDGRNGAYAEFYENRKAS